MIDLSSKRNILIVRLGKIGDIIIASSVFYQWKKLFPQNHITLVTLSKSKDVLKYNADVDKIYFIKRRVLLIFQIIKLRLMNFDLLVDLNDDQSSTSLFIRRFIKAKIKVGFKFSEKDITDISIIQPSKTETHIIERAKTLIESLDRNFSQSELKPILYLGRKELDIVKEELQKHRNNKKIVTINISAGASIRYWPEKKWIELINRITGDSLEWMLLILCTKKDESKKESILKQVDPRRIIGTTHKSFQHYAAYVKNSDILISPDTSAVHIASAFDVPVVAIYPNPEWNFISWQPLSTHFVSIRSKDDNISNVSVEEVYQAFIKLTVNFKGKVDGS